MSQQLLSAGSKELPLYMAIANGVSPDLDKLKWWKNHHIELPHCSRVCKTALLIQPSLAAAERAQILKLLL